MYCKKCGMELCSVMFCPRCGTQNTPLRQPTPPYYPPQPNPQPVYPVTPPPKPKSKKPIVIGCIAVAVAVVVAGGFAIWHFFPKLKTVVTSDEDLAVEKVEQFLDGIIDEDKDEIKEAIGYDTLNELLVQSWIKDGVSEEELKDFDLDESGESYCADPSWYDGLYLDSYTIGDTEMITDEDELKEIAEEKSIYGELGVTLDEVCAVDVDLEHTEEDAYDVEKIYVGKIDGEWMVIDYDDMFDWF